jgi:long-chain fatty acid transport protein
MNARSALYLIVWNTLVAASAVANGSRLPSQDGHAVAQGYAVVAGSAAGSSVYYNPAGLTRVPRSEIATGVYVIAPDISFTSAATGKTVKERSDVFYQPHFFAATPLSDRVSIGLGVYSPFGQSTDWSPSSGFAGVATFNEIKYITGAAALAVKLTDQLSFGAALQYNKARVDLNRLTAISPTAITPFNFTGRDEAWSTNWGLQWSPAAGQYLGVQYQHKTEFDFGGNASLAGVLSQPGRLPWVFPDNLAIGWQMAVAPDWDIAISYDRTFWGRVNTLQLSAGPLTTALPLDWQDSAYYGIGATHRVNASLSYSFGYNYSESSVPDRSFSPSLPDVNRQLLAAGVFFVLGGWELQCVLQRGLEGTHTVTAPAPDGLGGSFAGTFRNSLWAANLGATLRF